MKFQMLTPIHTCGGVPGCAACFVELYAKVTAAEQRERVWSLALQSLTPGGSEYADDPEACVKFVRDARESQHQQILSLVKRQKTADVLTTASVMAVSNMLDRDTFVRHLTEDKIAAEKRAELADEAFQELTKQNIEETRKGYRLVHYLGSLMLAAQAVVSGRGVCGVDELRQTLDVGYDPTNGEALSLTSQLAAANVEIERLKGGIRAALFEPTGPMGDEWRRDLVRRVAARPMPGDIHQGEQHEISVNRALTEIADLLASTPAAKEPK